MPAFVGAIRVEVTSGGLSFGDVYRISPKSAEKAYVGAGALNSGDFCRFTNTKSVNYYESKAVNDENITFNA